MRNRLLLIILLSSIIPASFACTIFNSVEGSSVLVGNNEDYDDTNVSIRFYPASDGKYGRVLLKINKSDYPFGGMNDHGLFFDWCALPRRSNIKFPSDKKKFNGTLCEKMLEECATVNDAINLYNKYNDPWLYEGHMMVVDKTGASAVIEWGANSLAIIKKETKYQVLSNFNLTDPKLAGWYPCQRYNNASKTLKENSVHSIGLYKKILDLVHQQGQYPTIYSNIYELDKGIVQIFRNHNYENAVVINLEQELRKGQKFYMLFDIFRTLNLDAPLQNQIIADNSVTFKWKGNAAKYELYCAKDSLFTDCTPVIINMPEVKEGRLNYAILFIFPVIFLFRRLRKMELPSAICLMAIVLVFSCKKEPLNFESIEVLPVIGESYKMTYLEPGKNYYWKIAGFDNSGFKTESSVKTFVTGK